MNGKEILAALSQPFEDSKIEWRAQTFAKNGNVLMLPYIDARAAMERLDEVLGLDWKDSYHEIMINNQQAFQCEISIKIDGDWVTRTDGAETTSIESVKGGYSSAFKRTCVKFGIGRYLYDLPAFWLPIQETGSLYVAGKSDGKPMKGFVNPPSTMQMLGGQQPQQSNQISKPQQATNSNQQQQGTIELQNAIKAVWGEIQDGNVGANMIPYFLERVGCNSPLLEDAAVEQLEQIYHAVKAVNLFLSVCRGHNLPLEKVLYYAQIICKVQVLDIGSLYFLLDYKKADEAIELIKSDTKQSIAQ